MRASAEASAEFRYQPNPRKAATARGRPRSQGGPVVEKSKLSWCVGLFILLLFIPWLWTIGPVVVSPYRLVLLATILPCLWMWVSGKAGGLLAPDIAIFLYCAWCIASLTVVHEPKVGIQSGGIIFIETAGAYLLGRCFIRGPRQFVAMLRLLFWIVVAMLPFAIIEAFTSSNVLLEFFSRFFPTHAVAFNEPRWGLRRVQTVFEHPILFGVSCGAILALTHLVLWNQQSVSRRWIATALVLVTASLSLSAGPMTVLTVQTFLISWDWLLRANPMRWRLLWMLALAMYVLISLVSNQSVFEFLLTHFSFDQASAYYRVLIWHFGSGSALNHPLFGVGFNRWDRPEWMPGSIDMFWLFHAVLFGIPAGVFMMTSFLSMVLSVAKRKDLDANLHPYRTAFLIAMAGYFLVGWTVHFWNGTYVLFLFLLGSGGWLVDIDKGKRPMTRRLPGTHVEGSLVLSDDVGQSPDNDRQQGSLTWKGARPDRSNGARRRERSSIDSGLTGLQPGDPEAVGSRDISSALQQRRSWSAVRDRSRHLWRH